MEPWMFIFAYGMMFGFLLDFLFALFCVGRSKHWRWHMFPSSDKEMGRWS